MPRSTSTTSSNVTSASPSQFAQHTTKNHPVELAHDTLITNHFVEMKQRIIIHRILKSLTLELDNNQSLNQYPETQLLHDEIQPQHNTPSSNSHAKRTPNLDQLDNFDQHPNRNSNHTQRITQLPRLDSLNLTMEKCGALSMRLSGNDGEIRK
ncbi:hypothetical protein Droror1_Dr00006317 [Drosera rotundifolia]